MLRRVALTELSTASRARNMTNTGRTYTKFESKSRLRGNKKSSQKIRKIRKTAAQSVQRLATGCTTEGSEFESRLAQDFSSPHCLRTNRAFSSGGGGLRKATNSLSQHSLYPGRESNRAPSKC
jgi:hypothetical protein